MKTCPIHRGVSRVFQWIAAGILLQTLYFKFTGAAESRFIFSALGVEPWGRVGTGVLELVAALMLLWPGTVVFGAGLTLGLMTGAVGAHLTRLGIVVQDDGGLLFALAVTAWGSSAIVLWLWRESIPWIGRYFLRSTPSTCVLSETAEGADPQ